jgi:diguanylate cyclase (GGDEF)-like protein
MWGSSHISVTKQQARFSSASRAGAAIRLDSAQRTGAHRALAGAHAEARPLVLSTQLLILLLSCIALVCAVSYGVLSARRAAAAREQGVTLRAELKSAEQALELQREQQRALLSMLGDGVIVLDPQRRLLACNASAQRFLPASEGELVPPEWLAERALRADGGTPPTVGEDPLAQALGGEQVEDLELRVQQTDGELRTLSIEARPVRSGEGALGCVAVLRDVTPAHARNAARPRQESSDLVGASALRDQLTGLYNRHCFAEVAEQALRTLARAGQPGCLFYADLDGLAAINDSLGHEMGDRVVVSAGRLLAGVFRDSDIVARMDGDEFAVLALECGLADIPSVLERIEARVAERNRREPLHAISLSVGTALFEPPASVDLNALTDGAEQAMHEQKRLSSKRRLA